MKTISSREHTSLVRYLLGELTEPEREQMEERYFFDEQYGELLAELETDLVDAYVEGTLTSEQRRHFETRYLVTVERNAAVRAAYLSKVYRDRVANPLPIPARPAPKIWFQWSAGKSQFVSVMAAGLAIVILGTGAWLLFDRPQAKHAVEIGAENRRAAPVAPLQNSALTKPLVQPESKKLVPPRAASRDRRDAIDLVQPESKKLVPPPAANKAAVHSPKGDAVAFPPPVPPNEFAATPAVPSPDVPIPDLSAPSASPAAEYRNSLAEIKQALDARYPLTTVTSDGKEIATPGAVLTLKKSGLVAVDVNSRNLYQNTLRNGRITQNALGKASYFFKHLPSASETLPGTAERTFVSGEKVWVTGIQVTERGIVFTLLTDPYNDTRYQATLTLPFNKNASPTAEGAGAMVADVFGVQQFEAATHGASHTTTRGPTTANGRTTSGGAPRTLPHPTTRTSDQPNRISLGQTIDEVVAALGQPLRIVDLPTKKIYVYKDLKVTFKDGKVSEVQ